MESYEHFVSGILTEERLIRLSDQYGREQDGLAERIKALSAELDKQDT